MIIIIIGTTASGIVGFRKDLIKSLVNKGHTVHAFAINFTKEQKKEVIEIGAIPQDYCLNRTGINPISDIVSTIKLSKRLKKLQPDIVFSYFSKPVIFGTFAAKLAGVKNIVGMLEGLGYAFTNQPEGLSNKAKILQHIQVLLYKLALPLLQNIIFLNPDDPQDLIYRHNIRIKKANVLGGIGLDLSQYPYVKPPNGTVSFLFIGRLLKEKGVNEFISAAKFVKKVYPNTTFTIVGELDAGNPGSIQQLEIDRLVISGILNYLGQISNVAERIAQTSVFVLPSYREGVPRSTQEAMAVGRPVITTDVPGCRETVIDGVNGFLILPWDSKALAEKMIYFIENPEQIEPMGLESYRMAQDKFDAQKVNKKLIGLLDL